MSALNVIQIIGIVGLLVAYIFLAKEYKFVMELRRKGFLKEIHASRLQKEALLSLSRSKKIQDDMISVASMTSKDVILKLKNEKERDPKRYYSGLGVTDSEDLAMDVSGSYEYGVIIGALWMARLILSGIHDVRCLKYRMTTRINDSDFRDAFKQLRNEIIKVKKC